MASREWDLVAPDQTVFGRLTSEADGGDMFWQECRFVPSSHFATIAPLFREVQVLLERDEMEACEQAYERIAGLGLVLTPRGDEGPIRDFLLHIDGTQARLRY